VEGVRGRGWWDVKRLCTTSGFPLSEFFEVVRGGAFFSSYTFCIGAGWATACGSDATWIVHSQFIARVQEVSVSWSFLFAGRSC